MFVRSARRIRILAAPLVVVASLALSGCAEELQHGYVLSEDALSQVQAGSSREQVLLVLGSPSTTA